MLRKSILFCLFIIANMSAVHSRVLIIIHAFNRPIFIEWQCKTFKKFLLDDYEFVVFNDAPPGPTHDAIVDMCNLWNVTCIPIPQEIHDREYGPEELWFARGGKHGLRHSDGIQYSLESRGFDHNDTVVLFDADIFMIRPFSFKRMSKRFDIASVMRANGPFKYLWPGLCILAMDRLPDKTTLNYYCGRYDGIYGVDTGGGTYKYLAAHPELRLKAFNQVFSYQIFGPDRFGNYDGGERKDSDATAPLSEKIQVLNKMGFRPTEIKFILK